MRSLRPGGRPGHDHRKVCEDDAAVVADPEAIERERRYRAVALRGGQLVDEVQQPFLQDGPRRGGPAGGVREPVGRQQRRSVRRLERVPVFVR